MTAGGSGRPLVFAHRGASAALPEHTLEAYELALRQGADGLECDVRLTRDGHLVCLHDARLERTSDGRGRVSRHTLAELTRLEFGSGGRVLTLDGLIAVAREAGRPVRLLVETKHPSRYGAAVEHALVALLDRHGLREPRPAETLRVTAMSFSPLALRVLRNLAPRLPTVLLLDFLPPRLPIGRLPFGAGAAGPGIRLVRARPEVVERLRDRGYPIYVWTVNEPADIDLVQKLRVNGIITDRPAEVLARLPLGGA
jgi:glycerophosphoryl diester phosphodiesterase